ncbi:hypothetical protein [Flavobacterium tructae]|uniref:Uncharacterized protein n=2 Tax=Flavobacterium tructae TaxID=1114873 RepID=A0A1S1J4F6_9FLAO|nr:hypothetical protein [Flavobacterium tructae]OHT44434.1 hypothetical protein BHE19_11985 [Flavobacterium tructae]OXB19430.1 hypothetical protein B0A71_12890 [Flavobacterium tructae]
MNISIENGRVFVNGKETVNPELIGYAILDAAESSDTLICSYQEIKDLVSKVIETTFEVNDTIDQVIKSIGKTNAA